MTALTVLLLDLDANVCAHVLLILLTGCSNLLMMVQLFRSDHVQNFFCGTSIKNEERAIYQ